MRENCKHTANRNAALSAPHKPGCDTSDICEPAKDVILNNPYVPPQDGRCLINDLPSELISHIFSLGWIPERDKHSDEDDFEDVDDEDESDSGSYSSASDTSSISRSRSPMRIEQKTDDEQSRKLPFNVLASHVCLRWRDTALSNSLLWNFINFEGPPPYDRAEEYLRRAGSAPLGIYVDRTVEEDDDTSVSEFDDYGAPKDNDPDLEVITRIMDIIVPHMVHCKSLQVMVSFYQHMHRVLQTLGACPSAPILKVLQLYHYEDTDEHIHFKLPEIREQPFRLFNGNAPCLNTVVLWGVHLDWSPEGSPFLTGLTDLELAYQALDVRPSLYDFARILRTSPDLRTLTLCLACPAGSPTEWPAGMPMNKDDDKIDTQPLVLPRLEKLVLAYLELPYLMSLVPRFSLPALTSLALDLEVDDYTDLLKYLASPASLKHPSPPPLSLRGPGIEGSHIPDRPRSLLSNLTSLKVASLPCSQPAVFDAYRQLDKLTSLNINHIYLDPCWFNLLSSGELLLPRLKSLTTTGVTGSRIRDLVDSRAARGVPLTAVLVNEDDSVDPDDEKWLAAHLERFEYFEGSDEETDDDDFVSDGWQDEDEDEDEDDEDEWSDEDEEAYDDYDGDDFEGTIHVLY